MIEFVIVLIIILLVYLYHKYGRVCSDDLFYIEENESNYLSADVGEFNKNYLKYKNKIVIGRLIDSSPYITLFKYMKDASRKGKISVAYKNLRHSPQMYQAFSDLVKNSDAFFTKLVELSGPRPTSAGGQPLSANQSNVSNLGLQVVLDGAHGNPEKFLPSMPTSSWAHIERSRGPH